MRFTGIFILIFSHSLMFAQDFQDPFRYPEQNIFRGGVGITWINEAPFTTITLAPDFAFGKFGAGLYLQLLMDNGNDFQLRKTEYQDGAGILRAIRYLRYGQKHDPLYGKIGSLEMEMLGNGFLLWNYSNTANYDKRKIGLVFDADLNKFGFESLISNLGNYELSGASIYTRPFRFLNQNIWLLNNIRFYGTFVRDNDLSSAANFSEKETLSAYNLGADMQFLNNPIVKSAIYLDYGKFTDYGSGRAIGLNTWLPGLIGAFSLSAKFEKRFLDNEFVPNFFGPMYELNRELNPFLLLEFAEKSEGYFGQLAGHVLHKIRLSGSFQRLNGTKNSGILHLEAMALNIVPGFEFRAYYDKAGIEAFEDVRTLDVRSVASIQAGYQLNPLLMLAINYRWYWIESREGVFEPVERFEPGLSFNFRF